MIRWITSRANLPTRSRDPATGKTQGLFFVGFL